MLMRVSSENEMMTALCEFNRLGIKWYTGHGVLEDGNGADSRKHTLLRGESVIFTVNPNVAINEKPTLSWIWESGIRSSRQGDIVPFKDFRRKLTKLLGEMKIKKT